MVRYYGRAKQRVGSVNTNQLGLKMSGCPSKIGKQGSLVKYQSKRSQCNKKVCGPIYYQGQMWSWNQDNCLPAAPKNQSLAGGVGNINTPRFNCNSKCVSNGNIIKQLENAYIILENYFNNNLPDYVLVLFGDRESLKSDGILNVHLNDIIHLKNNSNYPKDVLNAITLFNNVRYKGIVNKVYMVHEIALIKTNVYVDLFASYGKTLQLNSKKIVAMENNSKNSLTLSEIQFKKADSSCCNVDCSGTVDWSLPNIVSIDKFWGDLYSPKGGPCVYNTETYYNDNSKKVNKASGIVTIFSSSINNKDYVNIQPSLSNWKKYSTKSSTLTIKKLDGTLVLSIASSSDTFTYNLKNPHTIQTAEPYDITVTIED